MIELFEKIEKKLTEVLKYDQKFLGIIDRKNASLTVEFDNDEMVLTRILYYKDGVSVGITRYELMTVSSSESGELISDTRMIFEGWEEFLKA